MHPIEVMNDLLNRPVALLLIIALVFFVFLKRLNIDFPRFVTAVNDISSQPFALLAARLEYGAPPYPHQQPVNQHVARRP